MPPCLCGAVLYADGQVLEGEQYVKVWTDEHGGQRVFCEECGERFIDTVAKAGADGQRKPAARTAFDPFGVQVKDEDPHVVDERMAQGVAAKLAPPMDFGRHKGESGRVCVWGGSDVYTGAPFFASLTVLRAGGELVYTLTPTEAVAGIKAYSPELMVTPFYSLERLETAALAEKEVEGVVKLFGTLASRFHAVVIGPGLGVSPALMNPLRTVLALMGTLGRLVPVVIDADALRHVAKNPEVLANVGHCVLTPNAREIKLFFPEDSGAKKRSASDMAKDVARRLKVVVVLKGAVDVITDGDQTLQCSVRGAPRRCGGIGDVLSGTLGLFLGWRVAEGKQFTVGILQACHAACALTRRASRDAFLKKRRAMSALDVIDALAQATNIYCPAELPVDGETDVAAES